MAFDISSNILPILQTGSSGLAFLFGLMGLYVIKDWINGKKTTTDSGAVDIPPRLFSFMLAWLLASMAMFAASCYVQFVVKPVKARISISPAAYMEKEQIVAGITVGDGKRFDLPLTTKSETEPKDRVSILLEKNSQIDINIESITIKYEELKKATGGKAAQNKKADQGATDEQ